MDGPQQSSPQPPMAAPLLLLLINIFAIVDPWSFPECVDNRSCF